MDLDEEHNVQLYHLYKAERKFLAGETEEMDQRKKNAIIRKIEDNRIPHLSDRIQALVDDVALLNNGGYFDSEHWDGEWNELMQIEPRPHLERNTEFVNPHTWMPNTGFDGEVRLGYTVGRMLRYLGSNTKVAHDDLTWGFILGCLGKPMSNFREEKSRIDTLLDDLQKRAGRKAVRANNISKEIESRSFEGDAAQFDSLNTSQSDRQARVREDREKYVESPSPTKTGYLGLMDKILDVSGGDARKVGELAEQIQTHIQLINESQSGAVTARELFHVLYEQKQRAAKRDTLKEACDASKKQVSELMNNFGSKSSAEKWASEPPLVEENSQGRVGRRWKITPLGDLVGYCLFKKNGTEHAYRAMAQYCLSEVSEHEIHDLIGQCLTDLSEGNNEE